jgi:succinate-semialdehyde dehydrogenase/glutarate-semialdehyde dehydrogenase
MYTSLDHYIDGTWSKPTGAKSQDVINPASSKPIGELGHVSKGDLDKALAAAGRGFKVWRGVSAFVRGKLLRKAADLLRTRADGIATVLTRSRARSLRKPNLRSSAAPTSSTGTPAKDSALRSHHSGPRRWRSRHGDPRADRSSPVAAFSPWNFPVTQAVRKIAAALAAGCSIIIKCPEETPGSPIGLVKCFHDAGVPAGVVNLAYGVPAAISEYPIPNPIIRKVSFTGSVPVGKHLNALAVSHIAI